MGPLSFITLAMILFSGLFILLYPLHGFISRRRYFRRYREFEYGSPVSVLVPVKGLDEGAYENYGTILSQEYEGEVQIIFCLEDPADPAVAIIQRVIDENRRIPCRIVFSGENNKHVGKMHNLAAAAEVAEGDAFVFIDSDVRLNSKNHLKEFIRPLASRNTGLVTCYQSYFGARSVGGALTTIMVNADLFGYFSTLYAWGKLNLANGAIMAVRRDTLEAIGGLTALKNKILSDTAMARSIVRLGKDIVLSPVPAKVFAGRGSVSGWWHQASRWHVAMRSFMPVLEYFAYGATRSGLFLGLLYFLLAPAGPPAAAAIILPLLSRTISLALINGAFIKDRSTWIYFWLVYITDIASILFLIRPFLSKNIVWRGRRYRVHKNAETVPIHEEEFQQ